jgi:hypothetical protein
MKPVTPYLESILASGTALDRFIWKVKAVSPQGLRWPLASDTPWPMDRVQAMLGAAAILEGDPGRDFSLEQAHALQLTLGWDRVVHRVPADLVQQYKHRGLPQGCTLERFFSPQPQAMFLDMQWEIDAVTFHGCWLLRDRDPDTGRDWVMAWVTNGPAKGPNACVRIWREAGSWAENNDISFTHVFNAGVMASDDALAARRSYALVCGLWEPLVALLYDWLEPSALRQRLAKAKVAPYGESADLPIWRLAFSQNGVA